MRHSIQSQVESSFGLESLIGCDLELPSLPAIYTQVAAQLDDLSSSAEQVGETLQRDPMITLRLLKIINSAYFGMPNPIESVAQAVSLMGRERLKQVLVGSVLQGVFQGRSSPAFSMQAFWLHSIKTAIIARELARVLTNFDDPETLFTAGLLHDMGKLLLINRVPELMLAAEERVIQKGIDIPNAELDQLGLTHSSVGVQLLQHWQMPEILIECCEHHHDAYHQGQFRSATHLVYLANKLSLYVPPLDDDETKDIVADISNWDAANASLEQIANACQYADVMVFEVMESHGMVSLEFDPEELDQELDQEFIKDFD